jgi:hypothetical protein
VRDNQGGCGGPHSVGASGPDFMRSSPARIDPALIAFPLVLSMCVRTQLEMPRQASRVLTASPLHVLSTWVFPGMPRQASRVLTASPLHVLSTWVFPGSFPLYGDALQRSFASKAYAYKRQAAAVRHKQFFPICSRSRSPRDYGSFHYGT